MIQGERYKTPIERMNDIFRQITEYDIYRFYLGDFVIGEAFCNPLRGENTPSMTIIERHDSTLAHMDYGDDFYRGRCIDLVRQKYYCDYKMAISWIEKDFGLGAGKDTTIGNHIITWKQPDIIIRRPPKIHVVTRKPRLDELDWWNLYHQDLEDLKREDIFFPQTIYRNYKRLPISKLDLVFALYYRKIDKWKLYRPLVPKRSKDTPPHLWKWDTNVPFGYIDHLDKIEGQLGIMTKSRKDRMVLRKNLGTDSICVVSAEDPAAVKEEDIDYMKFHSEIQLCVSDNDKKGKQFSGWLSTNRGFQTCNPPDEYLNYEPRMTDFADMDRYLGPESVINHFKTKGWTQ